MILSVIIPCYNEEDRLEPSLDRIRSYLERRGITGELIAVDDGSVDRTREIVAKHSDVRLVSLPKNMGKGAAVREGLKAATGDVALVTDADLSTPIEEADKLLALLKHYDVVIGSRGVSGKVIEKYQPPLRLFLGMAFGFAVRAVFGTRFHDTQCGFKAMTGDAAKKLAPLMKIDGFTFDVEMLLIAEKIGLRCAEVGVRWSDARGSKLKPARDFKKILDELAQTKRNIAGFGG